MIFTFDLKSLLMKKTLFISVLFLLGSLSGWSQTKQPDLGDKVPDFNLPNQGGKIFSMKDSVGSSVLVIFFYPKGENVLTKNELVSFNDSINKFNSAGALVIGISGNSIEKLKAFHDKYKLKYDLLSDPKGVVLKAFGIKENLFSNRITYVINIAGEVVFKNYSLMEGKKHAGEALKFLSEIK
jgi:peroxiredoxin Q/BCP